MPKKNSSVSVIREALKKREKVLNLTDRYETPFYAYDEEALKNHLYSFKNAFASKIKNFKCFYSMKINPYHKILKYVVKNGLGLDVASGEELRKALSLGCKEIAYFSPGKKIEELELAVKNSEFLKINIDSFRELEKLGSVTKKLNKKIKAGVRIYLDSIPKQGKFGIKLDELKRFWKQARKHPYVLLQGIHFHSSRNLNTDVYFTFIKSIGEYLSKNFTEHELESINFIDFGGGFEPSLSEGKYTVKNGGINYQLNKALSLKEYAKRIRTAIDKHLFFFKDIEFYSEPGRIICNNAMHIVLSVIDVKEKNKIMLDGGVNMVGWQRFMHEYFPAINLSHPSYREKRVDLYGNLCTSWDMWGYFCFADKIEENDILMVPNQGALTYALAQNWIYKIPKVHKI